jgi:hypothetical protein
LLDKQDRTLTGLSKRCYDAWSTPISGSNAAFLFSLADLARRHSRWTTSTVSRQVRMLGELRS